MFSKLMKVSLCLAIAFLGFALTAPEAQAQYYRGYSPQVRGGYYGGSCNGYSAYRTYRPAVRPGVSVGFSTYPSVRTYSGYRPYNRAVYSRPVYYNSGFGRPAYGGFYSGPRYYGNRGGISIGIRF